MHRRHKLKEFNDLKYRQKQGTRFVVANLLRNKVVEFLNDNTNLSMKSHCIKQQNTGLKIR